MATKDGYSWTPQEGTQAGGLNTRGVIQPSSSLSSPSDHVYDAVVVGAGYAGLAAVRDLCDRGFSTLLLEARDRIGGRTYTVESEGRLYEMGGTWVTHHMAYLFREMVRYGMDRDLITTHNRGYDCDYYTMNVPGAKPRRMTHEEAGQIMGRAWNIFVDVDGVQCKNICPLPHAQLDNIMVNRADVEKWDKYSCQQRLEEVEHLLNPEERGLLVALLLHITGGTMDNSSLWDMIRSQALMVYTPENFGPIWTTYKLREGQSTLALKLFQDAQSNKLDYAFNTPINGITEDKNGIVSVKTQDGQVFRARRVISTIPLNVLRTIDFSPALSEKRQQAINIGHVNFMTKIHAQVAEKGLASWNGMRFPNLLMFGYGDGVTPKGDAHIIGFGKDERDTFIPERDPEKVVDAFQKLHPMEVKKTVSHPVTTPLPFGNPSDMLIHRSFTIGTQILGLWEVQPGGRLPSCPNTRMSYKVVTVISSSHRVTGPTVGVLPSMVHWSRAQLRHKISPTNYGRRLRSHSYYQNCCKDATSGIR